AGNDTFVFTWGDGHDFIDASNSAPGDVDSLSLDITPDRISAFVDSSGVLSLLLDGGDGGQIDLPWFDASSGFAPNDQSAVQRVQFVDIETGAVRIFDLSGLVASHTNELVNASADAPFALFDDAAGFEPTGSAVPPRAPPPPAL